MPPKPLSPPAAVSRLIAATVLALAVVVPVLDASPAAALTTYVVTRTDDPAPDGCNSGVDCSLREAVEAANTDGDDSEITFGINGTFVIADGNAQFVVADDGELTITGNGPANTIISAQDGVGADNEVRVFYHGGGTAAMTDLTITGGRLSEAATDNAGAGILSVGTLSLTRVTVTQNLIDVTSQDEAHGAGIAAYTGSLTVTDSMVTSNTILGDGVSEHGAGIMGGAASLAIDHSVVAGNSSSGGTAGIGMFGGTMSIVASTIENNISVGTDDGSGGGVRSAFSATSISDSIIRNNSTAVGGGGVVAHGAGDDLTVTGTDFIGNSGGDGPGGGAAVLFGTSARFDDVIFTGNSAAAAGALAIFGTPTTVDGMVATSNTSESAGGAVLVTSAEPTISNATLSNNTTQGNGGGIAVVDAFDEGGSQNLDLTASMIENNSADGDGGGLFIGADSEIVATDSQVATNGPNDCGFEDNGEIIQGGGSVDSDGTCFPMPDPPPGPGPSPDPGNNTGDNGAGNDPGSNTGSAGGTGSGVTATPATLPATGATPLTALVGSALLLAGGAATVTSRLRRRSTTL